MPKKREATEEELDRLSDVSRWAYNNGLPILYDEVEDTLFPYDIRDLPRLQKIGKFVLLLKEQ